MHKHILAISDAAWTLINVEKLPWCVIDHGTCSPGGWVEVPGDTLVVRDDPASPSTHCASNFVFSSGLANPLPAASKDKRYFAFPASRRPHTKEPEMANPLRPFDLDAALQGEKVLLRSGHTARIVHHNPNADRSDTAVLGYSDAEELMTWNDDGEFATGDSPRPEDIVGMAPRIETREGWINVYPAHGPAAALHPTKESADRLARPTRIACVRIEYTFEARHG